VRDFVLGTRVVNGKGEDLSFGGRVIKNVAGYDVSRLMAGSLGVLGLICEVSLKVMPVPPATATLCLELDEATALTRLNEWGGRPLPVSASSWCDGTLSVRLAGAHAAVAEAARALGGTALEPAVAAAFWAGLRDQADAWFGAARAAVAQGAALWRLSVPQSAAPLGLPGRQLIEWGGAQRWLYGGATVQSVRAAATAAGGHATLFLAEDRSAGVFTSLSSALAGIHRALKSAFDPDAVFNPGRLYPGL
jgi:glycolate oxidase FAD binding subunit